MHVLTFVVVRWLSLRKLFHLDQFTAIYRRCNSQHFLAVESDDNDHEIKYTTCSAMFRCVSCTYATQSNVRTLLVFPLNFFLYFLSNMSKPVTLVARAGAV